MGTNFNEVLNQSSIIFQENAFDNVICNMLAILFQPQYVYSSAVGRCG